MASHLPYHFRVINEMEKSMKPVIIALSMSALLIAQDGFRSVKRIRNDAPGAEIREIAITETSSTYQYRIDPIMVSPAARHGYCSVKLGNTENLTIPGTPAVPSISQRFIVPAGMKLDSVTADIEESAVLQLPNPITYADLEMDGFDSEPVETERIDSLYTTDNLYPASIAELSTVQRSSGVSIAFVNLYPYQFGGRTNELAGAKVFQLTLHYSPVNGSRSGDVSPVYADRVNTALLNIENPENIQGYFRGSRSGSQPEAEYLIITNREFLESTAPKTVHDLIERRRAQGLTAKIVTTDSIYSSTDGVDNQQKIRYFLRNSYRDWGMKYVLIAGDTNVVPVRMLSPRYRLHMNSDPQNPMTNRRLYIPSDYYYQCLDGPYNTPHELFQNDGSFWGTLRGGENNSIVDILPEFEIGRIPAETAIEFSNWLTKQFAYEDHSPENGSTVLFAGEHIEIAGEGHIMEYAKGSLEELRLGSGYNMYNSGVYTTNSFAAVPEITSETLYEKDGEWNENSIIEKINSNSYDLINHIGHGFPEIFMKMGSGKISKLTNTRPLMTYSQTCLSGRFTDDCFAERLLTESSSSGIWAGIFNTSTGLPPQSPGDLTDGYAQRLNRYFWDNYFKSTDPVVRLGTLNSASMAYNIERVAKKSDLALHSIFSTSLFGDPAAEVKLLNRITNQYLYLTSPVGGNTILLDSEQTITWHSTTNEELTLSLLASDGTVSEIGSANGASSELNWTPSAAASTGTGYRVVITSGSMADTSAAFDISDQISLSLTSVPTEAVNKGDMVTISWESDDSQTSVWLVRNGEYLRLISESNGSGSVEWKVPHNIFSDKTYSIRVVGSRGRNLPVESERFAITGIVNQFPYTENFEMIPAEHTLPVFWEQDLDDNRDWLVHSGPTPSKVMLQEFYDQYFDQIIWSCPANDHTTGTNEGKYCYIEAGESVGDLFSLNSPVFDLRGASGGKLTFWIHMFANKPEGVGVFKVEAIREGKPDTLLYEQIESSAEDQWEQIEISLADFDGELVQIRFSGTPLHNYASDMAIDDIEVTVGHQQEVSVLIENTKSAVVTNELIVVPSIVTDAVSTAKIYHKSRKPFSYRWGLYNAVGDLLESGEGDYSGNGSAVDIIDVSRFRSYTGATMLFLKATEPNGKVTVHKTAVGFKK